MSSGFLPGGVIDASTEHNDEWLAAQQEIEASRRRKAEQSRQAEDKSLYEILQANKAAKQEAFEESIRLKNQFRALDEDEVEFLDSVLESTRAEEERVRRETAEGLETFRRQQEDADKKLLADAANTAVVNPDAAQEDWVAAGARKRKRKVKEKEVLVKGVKLRTSSTSGSIAAVSTPEMPFPPSEVVRDKDVSPIAVKSISMMSNTSCEQAQPLKLAPVVSPTIRTADSAVPKGGLCLVDYGSDEE